MKQLKKISALLLVFILIMSLSITAFADASTIGSSGVTGGTTSNLGAVTAANTITFTNNLK
ncbi:MAG: hypothetical protein IJ179_04380 [Oscillospiraceae bacterium]|nr:hypothetical protein [Oscillospiraceae bacterium]